ncbi:MAG: hypothetical protein Ta2E_10760 [Mycoplasmoidaceae bacterium]|nr:MAG: hypothetical protein Ta2E_10760 [Mycoplasmoidaceae bacterium]
MNELLSSLSENVQAIKENTLRHPQLEAEINHNLSYIIKMSDYVIQKLNEAKEVQWTQDQMDLIATQNKNLENIKEQLNRLIYFNEINIQTQFQKEENLNGKLDQQGKHQVEILKNVMEIQEKQNQWINEGVQTCATQVKEIKEQSKSIGYLMSTETGKIQDEIKQLKQDLHTATNFTLNTTQEHFQEAEKRDNSMLTILSKNSQIETENHITLDSMEKTSLEQNAKLDILMLQSDKLNQNIERHKIYWENSLENDTKAMEMSKRLEDFVINSHAEIQENLKQQAYDTKSIPAEMRIELSGKCEAIHKHIDQSNQTISTNLRKNQDQSVKALAEIVKEEREIIIEAVKENTGIQEQYIIPAIQELDNKIKSESEQLSKENKVIFGGVIEVQNMVYKHNDIITQQITGNAIKLSGNEQMLRESKKNLEEIANSTLVSKENTNRILNKIDNLHNEEIRLNANIDNKITKIGKEVISTVESRIMEGTDKQSEKIETMMQNNNQMINLLRDVLDNSRRKGKSDDSSSSSDLDFLEKMKIK